MEPAYTEAGARIDYDSRQRRFISRDPLGEGVDYNLYRYANNNPVMFKDPEGLVPRPDFVGIGLLAGAGLYAGEMTRRYNTSSTLAGLPAAEQRIVNQALLEIVSIDVGMSVKIANLVGDGTIRFSDEGSSYYGAITLPFGIILNRDNSCRKGKEEEKIAATVALLIHEYQHWTQENYYSGVASQIWSTAPLEFAAYQRTASFLLKWQQGMDPITDQKLIKAATVQRDFQNNHAKSLLTTGRLAP